MPFSKKDGETIFDSMLQTLRAPEHQKKIGPAEKDLLLKIAALVPSTPSPLAAYDKASEAPDHGQFQYCIDSATVYQALLDLSRDQFVTPLIGGRAYLEHVVRCRYCQLLCGPAALPESVSDDASRIHNEIFAAAKDAGIEVDMEAKRFKDLFRLPRKN